MPFQRREKPVTLSRFHTVSRSQRRRHVLPSFAAMPASRRPAAHVAFTAGPAQFRLPASLMPAACLPNVHRHTAVRDIQEEMPE